MEAQSKNATGGSRAYKYTAIPSTRDIRCLTLEPGQVKDPIVCHLESRRITDSPPFEAISYVWGEAARLDYEITCDGCSLFITPNLANALRQCRLPHAQRILWADSICFNREFIRFWGLPIAYTEPGLSLTQERTENDDTGEKEKQVANMGRVYSEAKRVLICLGPDPSNYAAALKSLVEDVNFMVETTLSKISGEWNSFPVPQDQEPLVSDERWQALSAFIKHSWFRRCWVIQEASLAREACFFWGDKQISWLKLMRTYTWGWNRVGSSIDVWIPDAHTNIYKVCWETEAKTFTPALSLDRQDLLLALQACRALGVKDDRDRVYAFLGLPIAEFITQKGGFFPSYSKDVLDVYRDFAAYYIQHAPQHPLRLLQHVHFEDEVNTGQPSWVPIWHRNAYHNKVEVLCGGAEVILPAVSKTEYQVFLNDRALTCSGIVLDLVVDAYPAFPVERGSTTLADVTLAWKDYAHEHAIRKNLVYENPLLAFINLIRCGRKSSSDSVERLSRQLQAWMALLGGTRVEGIDQTPDRWEQYVCIERLGNRRIAVTQRGHFCLLPAPAQVGDLCCVLYGTELPLALRRTERVGIYRLIGAAYMVSSQCREYPHGWDYLRIGKGRHAHEDWLDWDIQDERITLI